MKRKVDIERNFTRAFFYRHIANIELCRSSAILVLVKVAATFRWSSRLEAQDFQRLSEVQKAGKSAFAFIVLRLYGLQQFSKLFFKTYLDMGAVRDMTEDEVTGKGKGGA